MEPKKVIIILVGLLIVSKIVSMMTAIAIGAVLGLILYNKIGSNSTWDSSTLSGS